MDQENFKGLLESEHTWPGPYSFKFIVPQGDLPTLAALFPGTTPQLKPSSNGKYVGATFTLTMDHADHVLAIYREAAKIAGIIAL